MQLSQWIHIDETNAEFIRLVLAEKRRPVPVLVGEVGQVADGFPELLDGAAVHEAGGDVAKVVRLEPGHGGAPCKRSRELENRAWLQGGPQVWRLMLLLLLTISAWHCLQHSRNLRPAF